MHKEMLEHAEDVLNNFCDDLAVTEFLSEDLDLDAELDPYTLEEKVIMSREESLDLEPHEISRLVQKALKKLPAFADPKEEDVAFDILYEVISEAVNK